MSLRSPGRLTARAAATNAGDGAGSPICSGDERPTTPAIGSGDRGRTAGRLARRIAVDSRELAGWLSIALLVAVSVTVGWLHDGWYDNDQWFIMANGRYVLENGFPSQNPFSAWGGKTVLDNWLWAVLLHTAYTVCGQTGITLLCVAVDVGGVLLARSIARRLGAGPIASSITAALYLLAQTLSMGMADRPFIASALMIMASMRVALEWVCRRWEWRGVWLLPVLTMTAFNLHMADGWFTIAYPGCWLLASVAFVAGRRLRVLMTSAGVAAAQIAATFINPWGVDGVLFVFRGMGSPSYREQVKETLPLPTVLGKIMDGSIYSSVYGLQAMLPALVLSLALAIVLAVTSVLWMARSGDCTSKATWLGVLVAVLGSTSLLLVAMRATNDVLLLTPFVAGLAANLKRDGRLWRAASGGDMIAVVVAALALALCASTGMPPEAASAYYERSETANVAARAVSRLVPPGSPIMSDGWIGSKLTWLGYKTSFDMRPELVDSAVTGLPVDHYREWINATMDAGKADEFVSKHADSFQWWVIRDYGPGRSTPIGEALSNRTGCRLASTVSGEYSLYECSARSTALTVRPSA